ncbi:Ankyrin repeats (3 copies) [Actinoalloteichus sp. GBA129-24]|nr:Ankyrin repeats (3 copies) [Actinoalloteichus sp. GBA129-24]
MSGALCPLWTRESSAVPATVPVLSRCPVTPRAAYRTWSKRGNVVAGVSSTGWAKPTPPWTDLAEVRARFDAGADPNVGGYLGDPPLHQAASEGSPEVVAELAGRVRDVDARSSGHTALWTAVYEGWPENARALLAAGADPWQPMMSGWSPGRLSLAGADAGLFGSPPDGVCLSAAEKAASAEGRRLIAALGDDYFDGFGLLCVADVTAAETARRLDAVPMTDTGPGSFVDDPWDRELDNETLRIFGVTDVPGGVILTQPWGYGPSMPGVATRVSVGTHAYGLYVNPKSGGQGSIVRDGVIEGSDLICGHWHGATSSEEVLAAYLYRYSGVAYACAYAGLRPTDTRPVAGPPDRWLRLPDRDYWQ